MKDLTKATKIDNQCALAYFNRAVCYHDSGQYEKALTDYGIVLLLGDQLMLKVGLQQFMHQVVSNMTASIRVA